MMASTGGTPKPSNRDLPAKEQAVFKTILKFYEHKQYKKGLKAADSILKKYPNHGETLAMRGLFYSHMGRRQDAHDAIKRGLMNDLSSHICWHVYGLLHRSEKNYEEAIKCYSHALKYEKENIQIIRDYSLLHIQMRNYEAFSDARHQLLCIKPGVRMNWMGLAVSYVLLERYDVAERVMTAFEENMTVEQTGIVADYENSEMLLFKNWIIEKTDSLRALQNLEAIRTRIVDQRAWKEAKARLCLKAAKLSQAEVEYSKLIADNPDSTDYLKGLIEARGLSLTTCGDDALQRERIARLFAELAVKYPRSHAIKHMPLAFASHSDASFKPQLDAYLRSMIQKGVPSLFVSLKDLLENTDKARIVHDLVTGYYTCLKQSSTFQEDSSVEPPTTFLWTVYFLAQWYDYIHDFPRALQLIDEALQHSPTVVELLMTKARIYKHAGDAANAMKFMNDARLLDLQDRFVNSKCAKYMIRNNCIDEAQKTISLFMRAESNDPLNDLIEMQCIWYALATGLTFADKAEYGKALKKFHQIEKHFTDMYDDQFDFHSFSLRKMTLRSYMNMLQAEDRLRAHPFHVKASKGAIRVYLELVDGPKQLASSMESLSLDSLSESERKKALRKARKAELKSQNKQDSSSANNASSGQQHGASNASGSGGKKKVVDPDPDGKQYVESTVDYLSEAVKFLKPLNDQTPTDIEGWILGCDVYLRKKKYMLALKCLIAAWKLDATHPDVHRFTVKFGLAIKVYFETLQDSDAQKHLKAVLIKGLRLLVSGSSEGDEGVLSESALKLFNSNYMDNFGADGSRLFAAVETAVLLLVDPKNSEKSILVLLNKLVSGLKNIHNPRTADPMRIEPFSLKLAIRVSEFLKGRSDELYGKFKSFSSEVFPLSTYFK